MDNVHCIGVGELTEEQIHFLVGSGTNDMLREELCQLQQPQAHQEDTNNNTSSEEVCWIGDGEPTEEQIPFLSNKTWSTTVKRLPRAVRKVFNGATCLLCHEDCYTVDQLTSYYRKRFGRAWDTFRMMKAEERRRGRKFKSISDFVVFFLGHRQYKNPELQNELLCNSDWQQQCHSDHPT